MPYCPRCDMEFVDGIAVCTDCGGPLVESEEAAKALKKKEQEEALLREREYFNKLNEQFQEMNPDPDRLEEEILAEMVPKVTVYESKAQKYENLKSSAFAFLVVGGLLVAVSLACWTGLIRLPMSGTSKLIFQGALTAMAVFSLVVYGKTSSSAKQLQPEIDKEKNATEELVQWFLKQWQGDDIDHEIQDQESLSQEEVSLKRFQIIQDFLITNKDLPDPAYVDALCEELYSRLFES